MLAKKSGERLILLCSLMVLLLFFENSQATASQIQQWIVTIFGPPSPGGVKGKRPINDEKICFVSFFQYDHKAFQSGDPKVGNVTFTLPILSQKPLLIWRGDVGRITVNTNDNRTVLWDSGRSIKSVDRQTPYAGKLLKRDERYKIRLDPRPSAGSQEAGETYNFSILSQEDADRHYQQLRKITQGLKGKSPEAIALARAEYLVENKLFLDALQEVASIQRPSSDLQAAIAQQATQWIQDQRYMQAMSAVFSVQNPTSNQLKQLRTQLNQRPCFPRESEQPAQPGTANPQ
jgi:hypothetical protein